MSRRYNTLESKNRREIVIKRFKGKLYSVCEGKEILFESFDFDLCCEFLAKELKKEPHTGQRLYA